LSGIAALAWKRLVRRGLEAIEIELGFVCSFDVLCDEGIDLRQIDRLSLSDEPSLAVRVQLIEKLKDLPLPCLSEGLNECLCGY
jgi:hypothetical protein